MSATLLAPEIDDARRDRILTAAERAFARHGFHGASMQDVAAEAAMSAGNLYRTFPSKDAIMSGLTARDQAALARDFQALAVAPDLLPALGRMLRKHLVEEPAWRAQLLLEIWAEAGRNPAIATMCGSIHGEVEAQLAGLVAASRTGPGDPALVVRVMVTVVAGLFKRRATEPSFNGDAEVALALGIFRAALDGHLQPYRVTA